MDFCHHAQQTAGFIRRHLPSKLDLLGQCLPWHSPPGRHSKSKPGALMLFLSREKNLVPQTRCELLPRDTGSQLNSSVTNLETNGSGAQLCSAACSHLNAVCLQQNLCVNTSPKKPRVAVRLSYFTALIHSAPVKLYSFYYLAPNVHGAAGSFFLSLHFHDLYKYFCSCIVFYFYPLHFIGTKLLVHLQCSHAYLPIYSMIIY